ncbi:MAG: hypothetical protein QG659_472 [Patescibacteria group bacterium]|nr:hypothetical protein [Patescibacteria group bacterium]
MLMQVPQIPQLGQQQAPQDLYQFEKPGTSKKKMLLIAGGVVLLLIMIGSLLFGGNEKPGQVEVKNVLQPTADALGIIDEYEKDLQYAPTKNDVALTQILIRGNYQEINTRYAKFYKPSKRFSTSPKPDTASQEVLEDARKSNTLDTEIIEVIQPKITETQNALVKAKRVVLDKELLELIKTAEKDMQAIQEALDKTNTL